MRASGALIGRERELAEVAAALDAAVGGEGTLLLVSGEPGIGKTRVLEEAARAGEALGFAVAWGRAWEMGGAPAFWPWVEALRDLGKKTASVDLPAVSRTGGATETERFLLFDEVATFLRRVSSTAPLLILLDDLHAADESSLLLTEFVARRLEVTRVVVIGSHRDAEARGTERIWSSLMRLARLGPVLRPARLDRKEVDALVLDLLGNDAPEISVMVNDASGGNPLFVRELVQLIAARSHPEGRLDVPEGVRTVLRQRLALLSPAAVALLSAAAVVGREFALSVVAEVAGVSPFKIGEALDEARAAEIIEEMGPGRYRFSHVLVAELLARELPAEVRTRQYLATAETLERLHAGDPAAPFDDIAEHYLRAGPQAAAQASRAATRAAAHALQCLAFEDAAVWFGRALEALASWAPGDAAARAEGLLGMAEAHLRAGVREPGVAACLTAAELARGLGSGELLGRAALTLGGEVHTALTDGQLVARLEEARAALPETDGAVRARVLARLAGALQPAPDPSGPMDLAWQAIAMARRLGDKAVLLSVLHAANAALVDYAPIADQIALNEEVVGLATARAARPQALRAHLRLAFARLQGADVDGFSRAAGAYHRLAQDFRHPRYHWQSAMLQSMRLLWEGRFEDADRVEGDARRLVESAGDDNGERALLMRRMISLATRAAPQGLAEAVEALARLAPTGAIRADLKAWVRARQGDVEAARAYVASADDTHFTHAILDPNFAAVWFDIVVCAGDRAKAEILYRHFLPMAGQLVLASGMGFALQAFVDGLLCVLADMLDRHDDSDRHAAEGLALMARLGAEPFGAQLKADWAEACARRGQRERASALAGEARTTARALGMTGLLARLDSPGRLAISAAHREETRAPRAAPSAIAMRLEGEFWTVVGCGELCRLKDSRGLQMLARLLAEPDHEIHVIDLVGVQQVDLGDAGEILDAQARQAYRERLHELRGEIEEASSWNDPARRARLEREAEVIADQLSAAVGLGNRTRRTGSAVERARVNAQRRIADALGRIEEAAPALGRTLAATVRTGSFCVYQPLR